MRIERGLEKKEKILIKHSGDSMVGFIDFQQNCYRIGWELSENWVSWMFYWKFLSFLQFSLNSRSILLQFWLKYHSILMFSTEFSSWKVLTHVMVLGAVSFVILIPPEMNSILTSWKFGRCCKNSEILTV